MTGFSFSGWIVRDDFAGSVDDFLKVTQMTLDQYKAWDSVWWLIGTRDTVMIGVSLVSQSQHIGSLLEPKWVWAIATHRKELPQTLVFPPALSVILVWVRLLLVLVELVSTVVVTSVSRGYWSHECLEWEHSVLKSEGAWCAQEWTSMVCSGAIVCSCIGIIRSGIELPSA